MQQPAQHQMMGYDRTSAMFSPDSIFIVTASYDKTAKVWQAAKQHPLILLLQAL